MAAILIFGTCDTKLNELKELRRFVAAAAKSRDVILMDTGRRHTEHPDIRISQTDVLKHGDGDKGKALATLSRGDMINHMSGCASKCVQDLYRQHKIAGIIAAGGSCGTSLAAPVMRALPIGFPKLIVSTVASGDTGPIVGESDISMTYSVVDIAGSNPLLRNIFANAAGAIAGMADAYELHSHIQEAKSEGKKRVGITMFGVTTQCCDDARRTLEARYGCEVYVFHATGHGGRAMERLVREGRLDAVLDITTTEVADYLVGGNMSAGQSRLEAAAACGTPCVLSLGATDMVNFGAKETVPEQYRKRKLFEHNSTVTLMRTNESECKRIGNFIVDKLKTHAAKPESIEVVIPEGGVSLIATPDGPFADNLADAALFDTIDAGLKDSGIVVTRDTRAINEIGQDLAERLMCLMRKSSGN